VEPRDRLFGPIASTEDDTVTVDFGDVVRKLVLFEEIVVDSNGLREFPALIQKFGYAAVKELLESDRVRAIDCNVLTFGQTGQLTELRSRERKGALPLGAYSFGVIRLVDDDRKRLMHDNLERIDAVPNLGFKQAKKLRGLIGERLVTQPPDAGGMALTQLKFDLAANVLSSRRPSRRLSQRTLASRLIRKPSISALNRSTRRTSALKQPRPRSRRRRDLDPQGCRARLTRCSWPQPAA
jgi:hypothetical protein